MTPGPVPSLRALVLAGGRGTRLRPLTFTSAKQLIPVANRPILFYVLDTIAAAGIEEVGIVVGETGAEIREAVGDGSKFALRVTYIEQEAPLGLAHAVKIARPFLEGRPFLMFLGDNLLAGGVADVVQDFLKHRPAASILLARVSNPEAFGVAEVRDGKVTRLVEKPKEPPSDLALVGVYLLTDAVWEVVEGLKPSARGELEITDTLQGLLDRGLEVRSRIVEGWWKDTGAVEDLLEANRLVLADLEGGSEGVLDDATEVVGPCRIERGAQIIRSRLRGPLVVGENAVVEDAYVGPYTAIGPGAVVRNAEVEHSIVLADARIEGVGRIGESLIGRAAVVTGAAVRPAAMRLCLGDRSKIVVPRGGS